MKVRQESSPREFLKRVLQDGPCRMFLEESSLKRVSPPSPQSPYQLQLTLWKYIYRRLGGESAGQPPQTGKSFRFVRACVRATDARFSYPMSFQLKKYPWASVSFIFCPAWFPFCSWWWSFLLKFGFFTLARIFYLWRSYLLVSGVS